MVEIIYFILIGDLNTKQHFTILYFQNFITTKFKHTFCIVLFDQAIFGKIIMLSYLLIHGIYRSLGFSLHTDPITILPYNVYIIIMKYDPLVKGQNKHCLEFQGSKPWN